MSSPVGILERLFEVRRVGSGRSRFPWELWIEVSFWLLVLGVSIATPERRADGAANAPGEAWFTQVTGGGICVYRRLTGIGCPTCGLTHGFVHLAHGSLGEAIAANPLTPVIFGVVLWRLGVTLLEGTMGIRITTRASVAMRRGVWLAFGVALVAIGVARIVAHFAG